MSAGVHPIVMHKYELGNMVSVMNDMKIEINGNTSILACIEYVYRSSCFRDAYAGRSIALSSVDKMKGVF